MQRRLYLSDEGDGEWFYDCDDLEISWEQLALDFCALLDESVRATMTLCYIVMLCTVWYVYGHGLERVMIWIWEVILMD